MAEMTLSESVAQSLVADIIDGKLVAGKRLDEQSIAKRFKVSRSPVRDALRRLVATQLVEHTPRRGFSVTNVDPAKLQDMYDALGEIEAVCASFCALRARSIDRLALEKIHENAKKAADTLSSDAYAALNEDFHRAIYAGARNQTLENVVLDVRQRLAPFRSRIFFQKSRLMSSVREHDDILRAILKHDPEQAAAAMRLHTASTAANVIELSSVTASAPARARRRK
jgi:DNA-binding GntR family transcriptional regulator